MSLSNLSVTHTNKGIKFGLSKKSDIYFKTIETKYNKHYFCCTEKYVFFCVIKICVSSLYTK
jgi:hypothetical protein